MNTSNSSHADWHCVLELAADRSIRSGSEKALVDAIARGADLHVVTQFRFNEHIDVKSGDDSPVREVMKFPVTYLIDNRWMAAIQNLRQPVSLPADFGARPSMSFFLYNQNGEQAVARPFLDAAPVIDAPRGASPIETFPGMSKMHVHENFDHATNAPSMNFVYDFDHYRFCIRDRWREVLRHDAGGAVISGSVEELDDCFATGCDVKLAISGLCDDLSSDASTPLRHEIFTPIIACYYHTRQKLFIAATQPLVRVRPEIPMRYTSGGWDFGWAIARTDGLVSRLLYDPYSLKPSRSKRQCAVRWFVG